MVKVIGVRFRTAGKIYYFDPLNFQVKRGDHVIVETARGVEYGTVVGSPREVEDDKVVQPLKPVLRVATERDDEQEAGNKAKEKEVSSLLDQVRLYVELDFDIPAILKLKHIKYRFGRIRKESFPQLQAFADRSDETILFKPLTKDNIGGIIHLIIADLNRRLEDKQLTIRLSEEAMQYIVDNAYDPVYGARPLKRYIQKYVETLAAKMILADQVEEGDTIVITVENDQLAAKCEKGSKNQ